MGTSRIAVLIIPEGQEPEFTPGHPIEDLVRAERLAARLDDDSFVPDSTDEPDLLYLAHSGTGVGGARPKALLYDDSKDLVPSLTRGACHAAGFGYQSWPPTPINPAQVAQDWGRRKISKSG